MKAYVEFVVEGPAKITEPLETKINAVLTKHCVHYDTKAQAWLATAALLADLDRENIPYNLF